MSVGPTTEPRCSASTLSSTTERLGDKENGPIVTAVAVHLFADHAIRPKGRPIDKPRNLAKSVTVE